MKDTLKEVAEVLGGLLFIAVFIGVVIYAGMYGAQRHAIDVINYPYYVCGIDEDICVTAYAYEETEDGCIIVRDKLKACGGYFIVNR